MAVHQHRLGHHPHVTVRQVALGVDELLVAALLTAGLVVVGVSAVTDARDQGGPGAPAVPVPSARPAPAVPGR